MTRFGYVIATYFASLAFGVSALFHPAPKLIWNASASTPIGLYAVQGADPLFVTELVVVAPPGRLKSFLAERGYLPKGAPLLKHILALPGQTVCRTGAVITVDGEAMGQALERDHAGRPLPVWQGCHVVRAGEVFLMNWLAQDSLDGRYFGVLSAAAIVGRAEPLWTREGD